MKTLPLPVRPRTITQQIFLAATLVAIPVIGFTGLHLATRPTSTNGLGDMSSFMAIVDEVRALEISDDPASAAHRITDFETAWDGAETSLRPLDPIKWTAVDDAADTALSAVRSRSASRSDIDAAVANLLASLAEARSQ